MALTLMLKTEAEAGGGLRRSKADKFRARRDDTMEDRKAFLIDGKWKLDGIEDQQATRVVQAIRSRRYVHQNEIAEALGIDQRRVSGGGERVTKGHWGPFRRGGQAALLGGYHRG